MEFLLSQGQSRSWLIGFTVVTITTAGMSCALGEVCESCSALRERASNVGHKQQSIKHDADPNLDKEKSGRIPKGPSPQPREVAVKEKETKLVGRDSEKREPEPSFNIPSVTLKDEARLTTPPSTGKTSRQSAPQGGRDGTRRRSSLPSAHASPVHSEKRKYSRDRSTSPEAFGTNTEERESVKCSCVCQGWAEIFLRRPSGNTSWIMRIENRPSGVTGGNQLATALIDDPRIMLGSTAGEGESATLFRENT